MFKKRVKLFVAFSFCNSALGLRFLHALVLTAACVRSKFRVGIKEHRWETLYVKESTGSGGSSALTSSFKGASAVRNMPVRVLVKITSARMPMSTMTFT